MAGFEVTTEDIFLDSAPHFGNHKSDLTTICAAADCGAVAVGQPDALKMSLAVGWFQTWLPA
jgi:hypothetical protein